MNLVEQALQRSTTIKEQYPDVLLLFRIGDFLEALGEDARTFAEAADITLTKRGSVLMCGIPCHSAKRYIKRVVEKGHRVAICEDAEPDYKKTSDKVTRVVGEDE